MNLLRIIFFFSIYAIFILAIRKGYAHCTMAYQQDAKGKQTNEYTHIQTNKHEQINKQTSKQTNTNIYTHR